jgi:hypothetical protein
MQSIYRSKRQTLPVVGDRLAPYQANPSPPQQLISRKKSIDLIMERHTLAHPA